MNKVELSNECHEALGYLVQTREGKRKSKDLQEDWFEYIDPMSASILRESIFYEHESLSPCPFELPLVNNIEELKFISRKEDLDKREKELNKLENNINDKINKFNKNQERFQEEEENAKNRNINLDKREKRLEAQRKSLLLRANNIEKMEVKAKEKLDLSKELHDKVESNIQNTETNLKESRDYLHEIKFVLNESQETSKSLQLIQHSPEIDNKCFEENLDKFADLLKSTQKAVSVKPKVIDRQDEIPFSLEFKHKDGTPLGECVNFESFENIIRSIKTHGLEDDQINNELEAFPFLFLGDGYQEEVKLNEFDESSQKELCRIFKKSLTI